MARQDPDIEGIGSVPREVDSARGYRDMLDYSEPTQAQREAWERELEAHVRKGDRIHGTHHADLLYGRPRRDRDEELDGVNLFGVSLCVEGWAD